MPVTGNHCVFDHRYPLVWSTRYRGKVLTGKPSLRLRDIRRRVCRRNAAGILGRALSRDHAHVVVSVPPKLAITDRVRKMKGRLSFRVPRRVTPLTA